MTDSHNINATEELIVNILETHFESLDAATITHAKNRIIDTIGCLIAGANTPGNSEIVELVKDWGGKEEASILIYGGKAPAQNAAMVNSIMARSLDCEPHSASIEGFVIPSHISGTTIMTAITVAEMTGAGGKDLITTMLAGEDLASRMLVSASSPKRIDSTGTVNAFGATAIAGRLLHLNQLQLRNAFGIVLNNLGGSYENLWDMTFSFKLSQGLAARAGIFSAQLAKKGWRSAKDPLFGKYGYYYLYFDGSNNVEILTKELGKKYYTEANYKPFPSCRYVDGPIECTMSLVNKHHINTKDVKEVIVYVSHSGLNAAVGRPFETGDVPYSRALFSYQYAVASVILRKNVKPEYFFNDFIHDPEIYSLINKIKLSELPTTNSLAARVEVVTNDGRKLSESIEYPKGEQDKNPMSKENIISKFWANIHFSKTVSEKNAKELLRLLENLEELNNVDKIVKLLTV